MRKRISAVLALISILSLGYWFLSRLKDEKRFLQYTLELQKTSVTEGWKTKWTQFLTEQIETATLKNSQVLHWDRFTYELKEDFYPKKITLDWDKLSENSTQSQLIAKALTLPNSWDRILALTHLKRNQPASFSRQRLSKFEKSIFDPTIASGFSKIMAEVEKRPSWQFAGDKVEFDGIFFQSAGGGKIRTILPNKTELEEHLLPHFLEKFSIPGATLSSNSLDIVFQTNFSNHQVSSFVGHLPLATAFSLSLLAGLLFLSGLKKDEKELLRKVSFLNQVVHELKTPLAGLKLHLQLMRQHGFDEENLLNSEKSVSRMQSLFEDIYYLQWEDETEVVKELTTEEAHRILEDLESQYTDALEVKGRIHHPLAMNPRQFKIVISNLVRNAIRYGEYCKVEVSQADGLTQLLVSDHGPGISKEESSQIFKEFFRAKSAQNISPDGLGLGLAICKKLCDQSGASIVLTNPDQPGAVFQLSIPEVQNA